MTTAQDNEAQMETFRENFLPIAKLILSSFEEPLYHSLIINHCNGHGPGQQPELAWSFSDAVVGYKYGKPFVPLFLWYAYVIKRICTVVYRNICSPDSFKRRIEKMVNTVSLMKNQHETCLKQLLGEEDLNEEKIKCLLAIHYFKPLSEAGTICYVDKCHGFKKCSICGENVKADQKETSFGNSLVWHGQADILVEKSVVKVHMEHVEEGLAKLELTSEEEEDETEDEDQEIECSKTVEVKTEYSKGKSRSNSQAIAQTIVNAFVESIKDKSQFNKFIPSFLATEKNIRIILYNCKMDKLLFSEELPFWEEDNCTLNLLTMIFVWIELNNFKGACLLDDSAKYLMDATPECRFKDVVGEEYEIYLKSVSRPCKKEIKPAKKKERFCDTVANDYFKVMEEFRREVLEAVMKDE